MKILYSLSKLSILLSAAMLLMYACIAPDMSDCPRKSVRLEIKTLADATRANEEDIENVYIYIFDDQQRFVTLWTGGRYTSGETYETYLDLEPGGYYFVVWTNQGSFYTAVSSSGVQPGENTPMNDLIISIDNPSGNTITEDIPDLYHGMITDATVYASRENDFTIVIKPNVYKINFTVEGLSASEEAALFTVTDNNPQLTFTNSVVSDPNLIEYVRTGKRADNVIEASMRVLKLAADRSPVFDLTNSDHTFDYYTDDLVAMIKKAYNTGGRTVDFDTTFEFDIKLVFHSLTDVTVSVNGWSYNPNDTDL